MSSIRQPNGEDHAEAAGKHLDDATLLWANDRWDGAAYLAGYVVECSLKSVILVGTGGARDWSGGGAGHALSTLSNKAMAWLSAAAFSGRSAKYAPTLAAARKIALPPPAGWQVDQRYFPAGHILEPVATAFVTEAEAVYVATVIEMKKDGLL